MAGRLRPSVGLALGSGAARGLAHIGVLEVFEEHKIPIDVISGASIGALIGGLYACGMPVEEMRKIAESATRKSLLTWADITVPRQGILAGARIEEFLEKATGGKSFAETVIPFAACAADICTGEEVPIDTGKVSRAIRASISIPGVFVPVNMGRRVLVDGGIVNPVPVDYLKALGVDVVVAVDIIPAPKAKRQKRLGTIDILLNAFDIMEYKIFERWETGDIVKIRPAVDDVEGFHFWRARRVIEEGRKAAEAAIPEILERLST